MSKSVPARPMLVGVALAVLLSGQTTPDGKTAPLALSVAAPGTTNAGSTLEIHADLNRTVAGRIAFYSDGAVLGTLRTENGAATWRTRDLSTGRHTLSAGFFGSDGSAIWNAAITTIVAAPTATWVSRHLAISQPGAMRVVDLRGDGNLQLALTDPESGYLRVIRQGKSTNYPAGHQPRAFAVADFDADGLPDAIIAGDKGLQLFRGAAPDARGRAAFGSPSAISIGADPASILVADFNRDGLPDLALLTSNSGAIQVLAGRGDGTFEAPQTLPTAAGVRNLIAGDFNGDGIVDLAAGSQVYFTRADGTFRPPVPLPAAGFMVAGDFDNNGRTDLAMATPDGGISIFLNTPDGLSLSSKLPDIHAARGFVSGDFDGDGDNDLAWVADGQLVLLRGDGAGRFTANRIEVSPVPPDSNESLIASDLDGDGRLDLLWSAVDGVHILASATPLLSSPKLQSHSAAKQESAQLTSSNQPPSGCSQTINVSNLADTGAGTLREAMGQVCANGTINMLPGVLRLNSYLFIGWQMTINGNSAVLDGQGTTRLLVIKGTGVTISNLTLQNGFAKGGKGGAGERGGGGAAGLGGAVYFTAGSVSFTNVVFSNNRAVGGDPGASLPPGATDDGGGGGGGLGGDGASPTEPSFWDSFVDSDTGGVGGPSDPNLFLDGASGSGGAGGWTYEVDLQRLFGEISAFASFFDDSAIGLLTQVTFGVLSETVKNPTSSHLPTVGGDGAGGGAGGGKVTFGAPGGWGAGGGGGAVGDDDGPIIGASGGWGGGNGAGDGGPATGGSAYGGAIFAKGGILTLNNVSFVNNSVAAGFRGSADGSAIYLNDAAQMHLNQIGGVIFSGNTGDTSAIPIFAAPGSWFYDGETDPSRTWVLTTFDAGPGSLRDVAAGATANQTIYFHSNLQNKTLTLKSRIVFSKAGLTLTGGNPSNPNLQIAFDGNHASGLFVVTNLAPNFTIQNLTLQNGLEHGGNGGNGAGGGGGGAGMGGAIDFENAQSATIRNVKFVGNQAVGGTGGASITLDVPLNHGLQPPIFRDSLGGGGGGGGQTKAGQTITAAGDYRGGNGGDSDLGASGFGRGGGQYAGGTNLNGQDVTAFADYDGGGGGAAGAFSSASRGKGGSGGAGGFGAGGGGAGNDEFLYSSTKTVDVDADTEDAYPAYNQSPAAAGGAGGFGGGGGGGYTAGPGGTLGGNGGGGAIHHRPGGGGGAGMGGAIFVRNTALTIADSTFQNNTATGGGVNTAWDGETGGQGKGGAIFAWQSPSITWTGTNSFSGNSAANATDNLFDTADAYGLLIPGAAISQNVVLTRGLIDSVGATRVLQNAPSNATITFAPELSHSVVQLESEVDWPTANGFTIDGTAGGSQDITIGPGPTSTGRLFCILGGVAIFRNITLTQGAAPSTGCGQPGKGGIIYASNATLNVSNVNFKYGLASVGGAMELAGGTASLSAVRFYSNFADTGSAINAEPGTNLALIGGIVFGNLQTISGTTTQAGPQSIVVTNNNASGPGSLLDAVYNAPDGSTITFAPGLNLITPSEEVAIGADLTIDGGNAITISGGSSHRVLFIHQGNVVMKNLTLANGLAKGDDGVSTYGAGGGGGAGMGGAVFVNSGSLALSNVSLTGNKAKGGNGGLNLGDPKASPFETFNNAVNLNNSGGAGGGPGRNIFDGLPGAGGFAGGLAGSAGGFGAGGGGGGNGSDATGTAGGNGGNGGFGGGGGAGAAGANGSQPGSGGTFAGKGGGNSGGPGAGLGGALFIRSGSLDLNNVRFSANAAAQGATGPWVVNFMNAPAASTGGSAIAGVAAGFASAAGGSIFINGGATFTTSGPVSLPTPDTPSDYGGSYPLIYGPLSGTVGSLQFRDASESMPIGTQITGFLTEPSDGLHVTVKDLLGHPRANALVTFTFPSTGAGVNGPPVRTATTDNNGIAMVNVTANGTQGSYSVTASSAGISTSIPMTNLPPKAVTFFLYHGPPNFYLGLNQTLSLPNVFLTDVAGEPIPFGSATFVLTRAANGATATFPGGVSSITVTADANGLASLPSITANSIPNGVQQAAGSQPGCTSPCSFYQLTLSGGSQAAFNMLNYSGAPASLTVVGGNGQSTNVLTAFTQPLVAKLTDANGFGLAGYSIEFVGTGRNGADIQGSYGFASTDSNGLATLPVSANASAGSYQVTASGAYPVLTATFSLTNTIPVAQPVGPPFPGVFSITLGPNAANGAVPVGAVTDNTPWSAQANDSWLHLPVASGVSGAGPNNAVVQFTADANTSNNARTGTLTVAGQVITVTQAGANFIPIRSTTTLASGFQVPSAIAVDPNGIVYFTDRNASLLYKIDTSGAVSQLAAGLNGPVEMAIDSTGNVFIANQSGGFVSKWDGTSLTTLANLDDVFGLAFDAQGNLFASTGLGNFKWNGSSFQSIGFPADNHGAGVLGSLSFDTLGNFYVASAGGGAEIDKIDRAYSTSTVLQQTSSYGIEGAVAVTPAGDLYQADTDGIRLQPSAPANAPQTNLDLSSFDSGRPLAAVMGVALDTAGTLYFTAFGHEFHDGFVGKISNAWLSMPTAALTEPAAAGTDSFTVQVLPSALSFNATSDAPWLTINGVSNGVVTFSFTANTGNIRTGHVTVLGQTLAISQSGLAITSIAGDNQTGQAGQPLAQSPEVAVSDTSGKTADGIAITFTVIPNGNVTASFAGGQLSAVVSSGSDGTATAPLLTAGATPGTFIVRATASPATVDFHITIGSGSGAVIAPAPGNPTNVTVNQPASSMLALVTDTFGNPVSGVTVTFAAPAAGPSGIFVGNGQAVTNSSGIATAPAFAANTVAGSYNVTISAAGVAASSSIPLTNVPGSASVIAALAGTPQIVTVATGFSALQAAVRDAYGNPISNAVVTFTAPAFNGFNATAQFPGGGFTATATTDSSGFATAPSLTATNFAGTYTVTANVGTSQTTFSLTNRPGPASRMFFVLGEPQTAAAGTAFAPMQIEVTDAFSNPVSGVAVSFTAPISAPTGYFGTSADPSQTATVSTDTNGIATAPAFTAGGIPGSYIVGFTAAGVSGNGTFHLTNTAGAPVVLTVTQGDPQVTYLNSGFAAALAVKATDAFGNPVSGATVTFVAPSSGPTGTFPGGTATATATTNSFGIATAPLLTANSVAGSFSVPASTGSANATFHLSISNGAGASFSLGLSTYVASPSGETGSVLLAASLPAPWTASSDSAWLHPGSSTGAGNALFLFTADANTGTQARTGSLTIAGQLLTVTQAGAAFTPFTAQPVQLFKPPASSSVSPAGIAVDAHGSLYFGDQISSSVLKWNANTGTASTVIGTGLTIPTALVLDSAGNLFVADSPGFNGAPGNGSLWKLPAGGTQATQIAAGFGGFLPAIQLDPLGNVAIADFKGRAIVKTDAAGQNLSTLIADAPFNPTGLGIDVQGNIYFSDNSANPFKLANSFGGSVAAVAGLTSSSGRPVATDGRGNLYELDVTSVPDIHFLLNRWSSQTAQTTQVASLEGFTPINITSDPLGNVYFTDAGGGVFAIESGWMQLASNSKTISANGGADTITAQVLPSTLFVTGTSDQNWLTVTGGVNGNIGIVSQPNITGAPRTANVTIFGQTITVTQPVFSVAISAGDAQSAIVNTAFTSALSLLVTDQNGNPASGITVSFQLVAGGNGAAASFPGNAPAVNAVSGTNGIAVAPALTANAIAGAFTVTAGTSGASVTFHLTNIAQQHNIAKTGGDNQTAQTNSAFALPLSVKVTDNSGNPVSGYSVLFQSNPVNNAGAAFQGGVPFIQVSTGSDGTATAAVSANQFTGAYTVTASTDTGSVTFSLTNTAAPPASIAAANGTPQSALVNTAFSNPLVARVLDSSQQPLSGISVTFAAPPTGASVTFPQGATAVTNSSGLASVNIAANTKAGAYAVTATVNGVTTPASFSLTNNAGAPASVTATGGTSQSTQIGAAFASPLQVLVTDSFANPLNNTAVQFIAPQSGPSATFATNPVFTDATGHASVTATANATAGTYQVSAHAGASASTNFSLTNTVVLALPLSITATSGAPQNTAPNTPFPSQLRVTVRDANSNPVSGITVTFTAPSSGASASFTPSANATTNGLGVAAVTATANATLGTYNVSAAIDGATPVTFTLTNTNTGAYSIVPFSQSPLPLAFGQQTLFRAKVRDPFGNPVSGAVVTFAAPGGTVPATAGGSFASANTATAFTDAAGVATSPAFTANATAGLYNISASTAGVVQAITFSISNASGIAVPFATVPSGLTFTADGFQFADGAVLNFVPGSVHTFAAPPQTNAAGNTRYGQPTWNSGIGPAGQYTIPASGPVPTVTGTFPAQQYLLGVQVSPAGSGAVKDGNNNPLTDTGAWYPANATIPLIASPAAGYTFSQYSFAFTQSPADQTTTANPLNLKIDGPKSIVANFVALKPALTISVLNKSIAGTQDTWTIQITNNGPGAAVNPAIVGIALSPTAAVATSLPVNLPTLAPGATAQSSFTFTVPSASRFSLAVTVFDGVANTTFNYTNLRN